MMLGFVDEGDFWSRHCCGEGVAPQDASALEELISKVQQGAGE